MIRRNKRRAILALLLAFVSAGGLGFCLLAVQPILELMTDPDTSLVSLAEQFNAKNNIQIPQAVIDRLPTTAYYGVLLIMIGIGIAVLVGSTAKFFHQFITATLATKTVAIVRLEAFNSVMHARLSRVLTLGPSMFVGRIIRDAADLYRGLLALASKSVAQVLKGLFALGVAFVINFKLTLFALLVAPILVTILRKIGKRVRRGTRGSLRAQEDLLRIAGESLQGLRAVKANTGERDSVRRFHRVNKKVVREEMRVRFARALSAPLMESLAALLICGMILVAAKQISDGNLTMSEFITWLAALAISGSSFRPLAGLINDMQAASAPAERLIEIIDEEPEIDTTRNRPRMKPHVETIEFEDVTYTYAEAEREALRGVSLRVEHGQRVAVVGPNGSGKTTLLALLPRLLRQHSGRVLIDGVDTATLNLRSLRRQVGVVTQETMLFRGSVAENISLGTINVDRSQIEAAAKQAHADEFVRQLPSGYDTDLTESGASLSGGQRQRLAIARAILRKPSILILDEATSQIDAESEAHINAALAEFCAEERTALIVAHRLATVLHADHIVVMDEGRINDQGRHDELLGRCELYRRLTKTQLVAST